jgi:hypothetical protein
MRRNARMAGQIEVGAVAPAGPQFSRQQPDKSQLRPLANAKRLEQLLLGMLDGQRDRVHGRNWQRAPRAEKGSAASY